MQRFCSNLAIKKGDQFISVFKIFGAIIQGFFLSGLSLRPTGLCDVVDNSTSLSPEKKFRACGKMHRGELSLIWGRRDEIGSRISSAA